MPSNDDQPIAAGADAPMPGLLDDYKTHREQLLAQARELERLKDQVRSTAEREAATIVSNARRDVRKVLLDARRELLVLVAQLQAVGCDTGAGTTAGAVPGTTNGDATDGSAALADPFAPTRAIVTGARRDVREVLAEARGELGALSQDARKLRARVANDTREHDAPQARRESAPVREPFASERREAAPQPAVAAPEAPKLPPITIVAASEPAGIRGRLFGGTSRSSSGRWLAFGAAIAFVAGASYVFWSSSRRTDASVAAAPAPRSPQPAPTVSPVPATQRAESTQQAAAPPPVPTVADNGVSLQVEVRRPSWIRTTIDGSADKGRLFAVGEVRKLVAKRNVEMRAGDAGAVLVSVNGGPAAPFGADGQVLTRRFVASQPAATATSGHAPTPVPARTDERVVQPPRVDPAAGRPMPAPGAAASDAARPVQTPPAVTPPPVTQLPATPPAGTPQAVTPSAATPFGAMPSPAAPRTATPSQSQGASQAPPTAAVSPTWAAELEILSANQRWFEAYHGQDRNGMEAVATEDFSLADERSGRPRILTAAAGVQRTMDQVRIQVAGDGAVLSARLLERATIDGQPVQYVSLVSGVWIRRDGQWRLIGVRMIDAANLGLASH